MDICFRTKKLSKRCNSDKSAARKWGPESAGKLRVRLDDLQAAETLEDIRMLYRGRCHELKGNRRGQLSLDLAHPLRLIFEPDHDDVPVKPDGGLDWTRVTAVCISDVEDTHE